jgi:hypothetical protein
MSTRRKLLLVPLLLTLACEEPTKPVPNGAYRVSTQTSGVDELLASIEAAVTVRGATSLEDHALIDGTDVLPPGWTCDGCVPQDRPGIRIDDVGALEIEDDAAVLGNPPVVGDVGIGDLTFQQFGSLSWADVQALATQTVGEFGDDVTLRPGRASRNNRFGPHKNPDGTCDTSHPLNFGSNDPSDPCYDHFPIVLLRGEVEIKGSGYMQGLFIMDFDADGVGGELDLEGDGLIFAGVVLGRGCIEVQDESTLYGAVFLDGAFFNQSNCPPDDPVHLQERGKIRWSSAVVGRTVEETGILDDDPGPIEPPAGVETRIFGSSSLSSTNPASLFRIDHVSGAAALIGSSGINEGNNRISAIDFDPFSGRLYGIKGGACHGALLIIIDPTSGAGDVVGTLRGEGLDFTPGENCPGGSDALAFTADGTLYASGWYGGTPQAKIMRIDKRTATVLEYHSTPIGFDDWRGRRAHIAGLAVDASGTMWVSRGSSAVPGQINTIDPETGDITSTLYLTDAAGVPEEEVTISDLAFAPDGMLYASLPWENMLAVIDLNTGILTRIGDYGALVNRISGLTAEPAILQTLLGRYWFNEASSGRGPAMVYDDRPDPVNLAISYSRSMKWTTQDGHRGLRSRAFYHRGVVRGSVVDTKYDAALDGITQATFVAVASWVDPPYVQRIAGFQSARGKRVAMLQTGSNGQPSFQFRTKRQSGIDIRWRLDLDDGVRRVLHVVYDAEDPIPDRRIRLYVDGVDQGPGTLHDGHFPALGEGLDFSVSDLELQMMNRTRSSYKAMKGTLFYYAVYRMALDTRDIVGNASALLVDDDDLP